MDQLRRFGTTVFLLVITMGCQQGNGTRLEHPAKGVLFEFSGNFAAPVWSPTDSELVVSTFSYPGLDSALIRLGVASDLTDVLLRTKGEMRSVAWSHDGTRIAFVSIGSKDFKQGIWTIGADGGDAQYVGPGYAASWAPNDRQMAILSCDGIGGKEVESVARLSVLDMHDGTESVLTSSPGCAANFYVVWSPNGESIAFSYAREASPGTSSDQAYVLDISSRRSRALGTGNGWSPTWSPDSKTIAYATGMPGSTHSAVVLYSTEQACSRTITLDSVPFVGEIAWSPRGTMWVIAAGGDIYVVDAQEATGTVGARCD